MKEIEYEYSAEKNIQLKEKRGISFDEIIYYIDNGHLLETIKHHNEDKYAGQNFYVPPGGMGKHPRLQANTLVF